MCRLGVFPDAHFQSGQTPATGLVRPRLAGKHQRTHKLTQKARLARVARCEKVAKGLLKGWQCPRPADRCASRATPLDRRPGSMPWVDVLRCPIFRFGLVKSSLDPDRATEWAAGDRFTGQTVESTKRYCNCDTLAQVVRAVTAGLKPWVVSVHMASSKPATQVVASGFHASSARVAQAHCNQPPWQRQLAKWAQHCPKNSGRAQADLRCAAWAEPRCA